MHHNVQISILVTVIQLERSCENKMTTIENSHITTTFVDTVMIPRDVSLHIYKAGIGKSAEVCCYRVVNYGTKIATQYPCPNTSYDN